jgi:hypothetical protein
MPSLPLPFTAKDIQAGDDRYYFQKNGVSYQIAFADFQLCAKYSRTVEVLAKPKDFAPLGTNVVPPDAIVQPLVNVNTGAPTIVGAILASYVEGDIREGSMRLCMSYRGYKRYAVARSAYRQIDTGSDTEHMARQAVVASGPAPEGGEVGP